MFSAVFTTKPTSEIWLMTILAEGSLAMWLFGASKVIREENAKTLVDRFGEILNKFMEDFDAALE